jgi:hypothetical protein
LTYDQLVRRIVSGGISVAAALAVVAASAAGVVNGQNRVVNFRDLPRGWGPGIPRDVRSVSRIVGRLDGHTIAAAPTRNGNYCEAFWVKAKGSGGWSGCHVRLKSPNHSGPDHSYLIGATISRNQTGIVAVSGSTAAGPDPYLYLVYADGSRERLPMIWVRNPIRAGFFYRTIPQEHLQKGRRPKWLELRAGAHLVARQVLAAPYSPPAP